MELDTPGGVIYVCTQELVATKAKEETHLFVLSYQPARISRDDMAVSARVDMSRQFKDGRTIEMPGRDLTPEEWAVVMGNYGAVVRDDPKRVRRITFRAPLQPQTPSDQPGLQ